jgi:hypothetical protein
LSIQVNANLSANTSDLPAIPEFFTLYRKNCGEKEVRVILSNLSSILKQHVRKPIAFESQKKRY